MAIAVCVVGLSGCGESQPEEVVMPEIVFVIAFQYPGVQKYVTDTFEGTAGYYITKEGEMRYFEIDITNNKELFEKQDYITMYDYAEILNINEIHPKITENSFDTEFEDISVEELVKKYKMLSKVRSSTKLEYMANSFCASYGATYVYGVKLNKDKQEEYILIADYDDTFFYKSNNEITKELANYLHEKFPIWSANSFIHLENKLKEK